LLRAWSDKAEDPILDAYPYATTSPIYIAIAGAPSHSKKDAEYFVVWIERLISAVQANNDWNTPAEKESVLKELSSAREVYAELEK